MYINPDKEKRIEIFEDTMRLCRENAKLADAIKTSKANTKFYAANEYPEKKNTAAECGSEINVTSERTLEAAKRLSEKYGGKRIAVLNFASATNPGGGVTKGSSGMNFKLCKCIFQPKFDHTKIAAKQGNAEERPDAGCGIKR